MWTAALRETAEFPSVGHVLAFAVYRRESTRPQTLLSEIGKEGFLYPPLKNYWPKKKKFDTVRGTKELFNEHVHFCK